jgi:hypothetical protein
VVVGFADGVLHLLSAQQQQQQPQGSRAGAACLVRQVVVKAHSAGITALALQEADSGVTPDAPRCLAVGSADGRLFFFALTVREGQQPRYGLHPLGFVVLRKVARQMGVLLSSVAPAAAAAGSGSGSATPAAAESEGGSPAATAPASPVPGAGPGVGGGSISAAAMMLPVSSVAFAPNGEASAVTAVAWVQEPVGGAAASSSARLYVGCADGFIRRLQVPPVAAAAAVGASAYGAWPSQQASYQLQGLLEGIHSDSAAGSDSTTAAAAGPSVGSRAASPTRASPSASPVGSPLVPGGRQGGGGPSSSSSSGGGSAGPGELRLGPSALYRLRFRVKRDHHLTAAAAATAAGAAAGPAAKPAGGAEGAAASAVADAARAAGAAAAAAEAGHEVWETGPAAIRSIALAPRAFAAASSGEGAADNGEEGDRLLVGVEGATEGGSHCLFVVTALSNAALARRHAKRAKAAAAAASLASLLGGGSDAPAAGAPGSRPQTTQQAGTAARSGRRGEFTAALAGGGCRRV